MRRLLLPAAMLLALLGASPASAATAPPPAVDTTIVSGPAEGATIEDEEAVFAFTATFGGAPLLAADFYCSVDGRPALPCESPDYLGPFAEEGAHSFSVYAEDSLSLTRDPSPAIRNFFVFDSEAEEEECEAAEFEEAESEEEGEEEECGAEPESGGAPPAACLLRSARAHLFASATHEKARLRVRYTAYSPLEVAVDYRLGGRGSPKLGETRARFSRRGVFRETERLSRGALGKLRATHRLTVELNVAGAPGYCRRYEIRRLTPRHGPHGATVWVQTESSFGG